MASLPPVLAAAAPLNPLEGLIVGINTNPYFIGLMMLLLNLGGRFLGMEISKEQEKWVRRALIFTVLFVATRNVIVAFIMTIFVVLIMTVLLNENSVFYLGAPIVVEVPKEGQIGLSPEEQDILRKLMEKQARFAPKDKESYQDKKKDGFTAEIIYMQNLQRINS